MISGGGSREQISHYRLIELLGRGGMGEVWLAEDTDLPRKVAVKLLPAHLEDDPSAMARLMAEARAISAIDHPNVVTVHEAGMAQGRPYLVMQRIEGETLDARLARGPLAIEESISLGIQIADALAEVHALGIIHRDLKPSNVFLTARGAKVLDFGLASFKDSPGITETGGMVGTPMAMSPEQIRGNPPDNRVDLWALGVILYHALTGQRPFAGTSAAGVLQAVLHQQPPAPSVRRREIGNDLDFVIMKLLRKDPAHRYARAEELIADLESCLGTGSQSSETMAISARATAPRLAVLPFEVLSSDPEDAFLAAGLAEDLIVDLTRVGGLEVAARGETVLYRDRQVPPRTLARELGVDFVLIGSVRRAGNRARISTQLVRASDGHALWAERFDRTLEDLFDVQAEVSHRIVEALQITLRPGEREMLDRAPTKNREAYGHYLRARELLDQSDRDANFRAEELLRRAIELDPQFALAHATLGSCLVRRSVSWWAGLEAADEALPCAERALRLEPDLLEGHLVRALVHRLRGEHAAMRASLEWVLGVNPTHPEAIELAAWSYMAVGESERALEILAPAAQQHRDHFPFWLWLTQCYEALGREEDADRARRHLHDLLLDTLRREPENVRARSLLASNLVSYGEGDAAIAQAERVIAISPRDGQVRYNAACVFARLGMKERAIAELKEGTRDMPTFLADWPRRDLDLASLRDHPEFIRLFGQAN